MAIKAYPIVICLAFKSCFALSRDPKILIEDNFSWSGFEGDATVVSFGDEFAYDKNIKFVLWDRANNAPSWRLTNQFLLNFEFFESGDSIYPGCHEAVLDRQRHGQSVTIVENNDVRKIIHWHGIPLNPNYNFDNKSELWLNNQFAAKLYLTVNHKF